MRAKTLLPSVVTVAFSLTSFPTLRRAFRPYLYYSVLRRWREEGILKIKYLFPAWPDYPVHACAPD
jgi:hypothetical protein